MTLLGFPLIIISILPVHQGHQYTSLSFRPFAGNFS
jgi:hypothetical protein